MFLSIFIKFLLHCLSYLTYLHCFFIQTFGVKCVKVHKVFKNLWLIIINKEIILLWNKCPHLIQTQTTQNIYFIYICHRCLLTTNTCFGFGSCQTLMSKCVPSAVSQLSLSSAVKDVTITESSQHFQHTCWHSERGQLSVSYFFLY